MQKSKNKSADPSRITSLESRSSQVLRYPLSHQLRVCIDFHFSTLFAWENNPSMTFPKWHVRSKHNNMENQTTQIAFCVVQSVSVPR